MNVARTNNIFPNLYKPEPGWNTDLTDETDSDGFLLGGTVVILKKLELSSPRNTQKTLKKTSGKFLVYLACFVGLVAAGI
ncbi:hypothetical protein A2V82_02620 [candidate division KSB1 bacterium RBG_16_48_16]|nr:MAG: hypothetical protein A2V82_02620 [candidate division KSB1 bacterium RBG_16_48_16]